jgi:hypothetical protein
MKRKDFCIEFLVEYAPLWVQTWRRQVADGYMGCCVWDILSTFFSPKFSNRDCMRSHNGLNVLALKYLQTLNIENALMKDNVNFY